MTTEAEEHLAFEAAEAGDYQRAKQLLVPLVRQGSIYARDLIASMWDPAERLAFEAVAAGDHVRARELLAPLVRKGSVHAMNLLGSLHEHGKMPGSSKTNAISYYIKAAEGGITKSFYYAGMLLLESGDKKEARRVLEQGAALGSMQSMYGLGRCLEHAEADQERQQSLILFERAAALGHIPSQRKLLGILSRHRWSAESCSYRDC